MMMHKVLFSINPKHVENILNGTKRVEYRKVRCQKDVNKIVIYSTSPVRCVVAEVEVIGVIEDSIDAVWELTQDVAGITQKNYESYYEGKDKAIAYQLGEVTEFEQPKQLRDFGLRHAPQSFAYVSEKEPRQAEPTKKTVAVQSSM